MALVGLGKWKRHGDQAGGVGGQLASAPLPGGKPVPGATVSQGSSPWLVLFHERGEGIPAAGFAKGQEFLATPRASALWAGF